MLPTFVIGLREGLEAALIVGIIAAFLRKQGRRDLLRWVLGGVGIAVLICVAAGVALRIYSQDLPQKQQEGLETVIGAVAVGMVTYMVVWMRRNSRNLKGQLEGLAADALGGRSSAARAMVLMAFLAVIREGLETVVFVLAAFNEASNGTTAGIGLLLGLALAVALGYGIYRGGVRINLSKFFRATGLVLVLVAAGLVVNALHTAHEAGWLNAGQGRTVDLTWLVDPGSVQSSLLTGMLGLQPFPVTIEVIGWLVYLVPVGVYVAWPPGKRVPLRGLAISGAVTAVLAGVAALLCFTLAPGAPAQRPQLQAQGSAGPLTAQVVGTGDSRALAVGGAGLARSVTLGQRPSAVERSGRPTDRYRVAVVGRATAANLPRTLTLAQAAQLNGNRLPIGLNQAGTQTVSAAYTRRQDVTAWLDPHTERVVDLSVRTTVTATLTAGTRVVTLDSPVTDTTATLSPAARADAAAASAAEAATLDHRTTLHTLAAWLLALALAGLATGLVCTALRRRRHTVARPAGRTPQLVKTAT